MIANAARFGAGAALAALVFLSWREPVERCWPLDTSPGAWACIGAARPPTSVRPVEAAPALGAAEAELSDEFRRAVLAAAEYAATGERLPTPNARLPLPTWLPAGVLGWEAEIREAAGRVGLDPLALAILVSIECPSGNPNCDSSNPPAFPDGAVGLSQFMRTTANAVAERSGIPCWNRTDPVVSLRCGAYHFVELLSMCGDVWQTGREAPAIACAGAGYNAGPGYIPAMVRHIQAGGSLRAAPVPGQTQDWIDMALDRWAQGGRQ